MNARALFVAAIAIAVWIAVIETRPTPIELAASIPIPLILTGK